VLVLKFELATQNTVVVDASLRFTDGVVATGAPEPGDGLPGVVTYVPSAPIVADVVLTPTVTDSIAVVPVGVKSVSHETIQLPGASDMLAVLAWTNTVNGTFVRFVGVGASPMLPACALSFVAVALMPIVEDGVIRAENVCAPLHVFAPFSRGTVAPLVPVLTVADVPSPRFVRDVAALATSDRLLALASPPIPAGVTVPHPADVVGPVDTIAWPDVEPAGLMSAGGTNVVAYAEKVSSAASAPARIRFI
jgi:hypothetical protein